MRIAIPLDILPQPDESTCGPTSLQTIYAYYGDAISLDTVIKETEQLEEGGTFGSFLAIHALQRGYKVIIYTFNLNVFDPTWFDHDSIYIYGANLGNSCNLNMTGNSGWPIMPTPAFLT